MSTSWTRFKKLKEFDATAGGESPLGGNMPDMLATIGPNRGSDTPASAEVKRTGLQPQVDAQEIETKQKKEQDRLQAIDTGIQRLDQEIPDGDDEDTPKTNRFRKLWEKLKADWDELKVSDNDDDQEDQSGLGDHQQKDYEDTMRKYPNMVPAQDQFPAGPGTFGVS